VSEEGLSDPMNHARWSATETSERDARQLQEVSFLL
jgi:hypothetical protein